MSKVLNFFTTPVETIVEPTPEKVETVEPPPPPETVEPLPKAETVEPPPKVVPNLPTVQTSQNNDEFSRDEFLRLYRTKPVEFSRKYAEKYSAQVAKQLAQSISFE